MQIFAAEIITAANKSLFIGHFEIVFAQKKKKYQKYLANVTWAKWWPVQKFGRFLWRHWTRRNVVSQWRGNLQMKGNLSFIDSYESTFAFGYCRHVHGHMWMQEPCLLCGNVLCEWRNWDDPIWCQPNLSWSMDGNKHVGLGIWPQRQEADLWVCERHSCAVLFDLYSYFVQMSSL